MIARLLAAGIVALALLAAAWPAAAQECEPKTWRNPSAPGSTRVEAWELDGRVDAWWCPTAAPAGAPAGTSWFVRNYAGGLYVHGWDAARAAAPRVLAASNPWAQFIAKRDAVAATVKPTAAQACRAGQIKHAACVALYVARLPGYPGAMRAEALEAARCGPAPDCAVLPAVWRTPGGGSSIYPVSGARIGPPIAGRRAPGNALCDLARFRYAAGSYTYGALADGPATEAVLCVQSTL